MNIPRSRMTDEERQIVDALKDVVHCGDVVEMLRPLVAEKTL
jgi:hypothetical protein